MSSHEGNTDSWLKRTLFLISLIVTIYGMTELAVVWPVPPTDSARDQSAALSERSSDPSSLVNKESSSLTNKESGSLTEFLQGLDHWYESEINVDHHDDEKLVTGHEYDHDEGEEHSQEDKNEVIPRHESGHESNQGISHERDKRETDPTPVVVTQRGDIVSGQDKQQESDQVIVESDEGLKDPFSNVWTESSTESTQTKLPIEDLSTIGTMSIKEASVANDDNDDDLYAISDDELNELLKRFDE